MKGDKEFSYLVFTNAVRQQLKRKGYKFLQVRSMTSNGEHDFIMACYFLLTPYDHLPRDGASIEVYDSIDSPIILEWAELGDQSILVRKQYLL